MDNSFSNAGTAFAVVSPCSQCKNQLTEMSDDGKPFCPRRKWQADQQMYMDKNNGSPDPNLAPLTAYGTEGTPQEGSQALRNPVYLDNGKTTLVWIAPLRDNNGVRDGDNNVVAPSILDPSFIPDFTDRIHCRLYPFIPAQHEASYRQSGGLKEGDTVVATTVQEQQFNSTTVVSGDDPSAYQPIYMEGVVNKVSLVYRTPRTAVEIDHVVQGS